jgi:hypothetical protein
VGGSGKNGIMAINVCLYTVERDGGDTAVDELWSLIDGRFNQRQYTYYRWQD